MSTSKPILTIVTQAIRRDIHDPLRFFNDFRVTHFYHEAPYGDMTESDFKGGVEAVQFKSAGDLYRKLSDAKPDIIQGAEPYASRKALRFSLVAQKVARQTGAKFIFPMLENRPASSRFGFAAPAVKQILRSYAKKSDLIFTLNKGAMHNLHEVGISSKKIVPFMWGVWGVDTNLFTNKKNGKEPKWNRPTILYVGRLVEEKGIADILEAFKMVTAIVPANLVFIGSGPMEKDINAYTSCGDSRSSIKYLGVKPQQELPPYFRGATLSVYPSKTTPRWEEQIGTVNLQAMSCATPVVSTQSGATPEYVPDGKVGFLVPEGEPQELAKAMLAVIKNKELADRFGKAGREYALQHFDIRRNVEEGEKWLKKIIEK